MGAWFEKTVEKTGAHINECQGRFGIYVSIFPNFRPAGRGAGRILMRKVDVSPRHLTKDHGTDQRVQEAR
jgi:hypothetical protein